jgi:hypothetical protein
MSLLCIIMPSVEILYFDGTNFVLCKSQMSSYLYEINSQVWWMTDIDFSYALEDYPQQIKWIVWTARCNTGPPAPL